MDTDPKAVTRSKRPPETGFQLRRGRSIDDNIRRLRKYLDRIARTPKHCRWARALRLKNRIRAMRAAK